MIEQDLLHNTVALDQINQVYDVEISYELISSFAYVILFLFTIRATFEQVSVLSKTKATYC